MFGWVPENSQEIIFKCLFHSKIKKKKKTKISALEPSTQTQGPKKKKNTKTKYLDDQYKKI